MDAPKGQIQVAEHLVEELNNLFTSLSLPLTVATPYDLTPSLLLVILESILQARLPISNVIRESQTPASKVEAMKIFLGVLEDDVLRMDIGLSEIDPRRLAAGEWDDLVFVGETLCWIARHKGVGLLAEPASDPSGSSSAGSNKNTSVYTVFSPVEASQSSATTVPSEAHPARGDSRTNASKLARAPRCIHEVETSFSIETHSVSLDTSEEFCDCSKPDRSYSRPSSASGARQATVPKNPPLGSVPSRVRYQGWIEPADDDVPAFEAWQKRSCGKQADGDVPAFGAWQEGSRGKQTPRRSNASPRHWTGTPHTSEHISSPYYTLSLLQERARLLGELAKLKSEARQRPPQST